MTRHLLFVGDASWDITLTVDHIPDADEKVFASSLHESAGGVAANAAIAAHVRGSAARALLAIGSDMRGGMLTHELRRLGVECVGAASGDTTVCVTLLDTGGEKRLILQPGSSMYPTVDAIESASLDEVAWVHTAIYDRRAAASLIQRCRRENIPWSLDLEPATFPTGIEDIADQIRGAAVVFCNDAAASAIGAAPEEALARMGAERIVRTLGPKGARLHTGSNSHQIDAVSAPDLHEQIVDTTGAGDCLAGWFVAGLAHGVDADTALRHAVVAATLSCTRVGAHSGYPTREVVEMYPQTQRPASLR